MGLAFVLGPSSCVIALRLGPRDHPIEVVDVQGRVSGRVTPTSGGSAGQFADAAKLLDHFARHGTDFGATSAAQYEAMADTFLNGPRGAGVLQKTRANGDIMRYDPATQAFGVVKPDGTIRTYYKPDPAVHGYPTNRDYFNAQ
jgi:filamentous hemagglutinin